MVNELDRLKADLEVIERYQAYSILENVRYDLADKIARLEAEADTWHDARVFANEWRDASPNDYPINTAAAKCFDRMIAKIEAQKKQIDHLHKEYDDRGLQISELVTDNDRLESLVKALQGHLEKARGKCNELYEAKRNAESQRDKLEKRVAELEADKADAEEIESDYYNVSQAAKEAYEAKHQDADPVLESDRVLQTAIHVLERTFPFRSCTSPAQEAIAFFHRHADSSAKPYRLKGNTDTEAKRQEMERTAWEQGS